MACVILDGSHRSSYVGIVLRGLHNHHGGIYDPWEENKSEIHMLHDWWHHDGSCNMWLHHHSGAWITLSASLTWFPRIGGCTHPWMRHVQIIVVNLMIHGNHIDHVNWIDAHRSWSTFLMDRTIAAVSYKLCHLICCQSWSSIYTSHRLCNQYMQMMDMMRTIHNMSLTWCDPCLMMIR